MLAAVYTLEVFEPVVNDLTIYFLVTSGLLIVMAMPITIRCS